jgi:hypothetical protein
MTRIAAIKLLWKAVLAAQSECLADTRECQDALVSLGVTLEELEKAGAHAF